jgi:hypothetical protein
MDGGLTPQEREGNRPGCKSPDTASLQELELYNDPTIHFV